MWFAGAVEFPPPACTLVVAVVVVFCALMTLKLAVVISANDAATMAIITNIVFIFIFSTLGKRLLTYK